VPTLKSVGPAAARRGTQSTWRVSGTNLTAVKRWLVSGEGVDVVTAKPAAEGEVEVRVTVSETAALGYRELRALANEGLSNFRVVRIDTLHEREEAEPNDTQSQAQPISPGEAVSATLKEREYDYFKIHLPAERPFVIDVEAQRLGQPVRPVLTLFDSAGNALNQATETRGLAHDARLAFVTSSFWCGMHFLPEVSLCATGYASRKVPLRRGFSRSAHAAVTRSHSKHLEETSLRHSFDHSRFRRMPLPCSTHPRLMVRLARFVFQCGWRSVTARVYANLRTAKR
jgi:hypothetical protein